MKQSFPQVNKLILLKSLENYPLFLRQRLAKRLIFELKASNVKEASLSFCEEALKKLLCDELKASLQRVINATGVVVHTNLGRSLIHPVLIKRALPLLSSYTNLELSLKTGKRGNRHEELCKNLCQLFNAQDALVVNNNAAAVFLVINSLAKNKEVLTSRGELVEIGGSFRVPEVVVEAGGVLKEVGTTNKTKLKDYEAALNLESKMLLKTHKSNFTQSGFCEETPLKSLYELGQKTGLITYYDLGSGYAYLKNAKLQKQDLPVKELINHCDLLSFSADKLLGCVQAGIILGKKELLDKLKSNQLFRMLRLDKTHISLLNEGVKAYLNKEFELIPTLKMLHLDKEIIKQNALSVKLKGCELVKCYSLVGAGAMPTQELESYGLFIKNGAKELLVALREKGVIARMEEKGVLLDFRTVLSEQLEELKEILKTELKA